MKNKIFSFIVIICIAQLSYAQIPHWQWARGATADNLCGQADITSSMAFGLAVDGDGSSYETGAFTGGDIIFGADTLVNSGYCGHNSLFIVKYDSSGNVLWAKTAIGRGPRTAIINQISDVATDDSNNVYIVGDFYNDSIIFGQDTLINYSIYGNDIFIVKYNTTGNVVWAKSVGENGYDFANKVIVDNSGNLYVTGSFSSDSITFDSITLTNNTNFTGNYFFIAKYNTIGNAVWAKEIKCNQIISTGGIAIDNGGNVLITGEFYNDTIVVGSDTLRGQGNNDIFIAKYNSSGNVLWARSAGGSQDDYSYGIAVDNNMNSYISGSFSSSNIVFDTDTLFNTNAGNSDIFIVKYSSTGNVDWAKSVGGNNNDEGDGIAIDDSGFIYLTGNFASGGITFGSSTLSCNGQSDIFVAKYDTSGNAVWAKSAGGNNYESGIKIVVDNNENIYLAGLYASNSIAFGSTILNNVHPDTASAFLAKLSDYTTTNISNKQKILKIDFNIFPNPFSSSTVIETAKALKNATLSVYDVLGQKVKQINHISGSKIILQRGNLPEGIYFIRLYEKDKILLTKKIIITN